VTRTSSSTGRQELMQLTNLPLLTRMMQMIEIHDVETGAMIVGTTTEIVEIKEAVKDVDGSTDPLSLVSSLT
jgi:hypothetical protein